MSLYKIDAFLIDYITLIYIIYTNLYKLPPAISSLHPNNPSFTPIIVLSIYVFTSIQKVNIFEKRYWNLLLCDQKKKAGFLAWNAALLVTFVFAKYNFANYEKRFTF